MQLITAILLFSFGASSVLAGGMKGPAVPGPRAIKVRQTNREQVVRRLNHGMRRQKRQDTASAVPNVCGGPSQFLVQFSGSDTAADNQYAKFATYEEGTYYIVPTDTPQDATIFTLSDACSLGNQGLTHLADGASETASPVFFDTPGVINESGYYPSSCRASGGSLTCTIGQSTVFSLCPNGDLPDFLSISTADAIPSGCSVVNLNVASS